MTTMPVLSHELCYTPGPRPSEKEQRTVDRRSCNNPIWQNPHGLHWRTFEHMPSSLFNPRDTSAVFHGTSSLLASLILSPVLSASALLSSGCKMQSMGVSRRPCLRMKINPSGSLSIPLIRLQVAIPLVLVHAHTSSCKLFQVQALPSVIPNMDTVHSPPAILLELNVKLEAVPRDSALLVPATTGTYRRPNTHHLSVHLLDSEDDRAALFYVEDFLSQVSKGPSEAPSMVILSLHVS